MFFSWLKKYMPRGLYGRAALIVLVPIVVIQLVVLVTFSLRYFDDITQQLMRGVNAEVELYVVAVEAMAPQNGQDAHDTLNTRLGFDSAFGPDVRPVTTQRVWYDVSSRVIERELSEAFPSLQGVDTKSDLNFVRFSLSLGDTVLVMQVPRERASASNPHQLLVWTIFTGILMTLVAFVFMRNQLRPIRQLAKAAEGFGRGEMVPFRLRGASEVRSAGAAFLSMRARIERQIEQRTLMLSGVSHDLRTPLTRLRLGLSMLTPQKGEAEDVAAMQTDIDEMERLIDAFLSFARSDQVEDVVELDLTKMIETLVERAGRAGGDVHFDNQIKNLTGGPLMLKARELSLQQAIGNLIGNALRYGSKALVRLHVYDKAVVLSVEDNGPGIPEEDRERALQPFVRLDAARNQNRGSGVGLGLAIAFDTARRHGGTLRLSEGKELGGLCAELVLAR